MIFTSHQKLVRDSLLPAVVALNPEIVPKFYEWETGYIAKRTSDWKAGPLKDDHQDVASELLTLLLESNEQRPD